jgi:CHAD domain-containing protein
MTAELAEDGDRGAPAVQYLRRVPGLQPAEEFAAPSAGMVLHRVLAGSARTFLLNDMGNELLDETKRCETVGALNIMMQTRPVWAESAASELDGNQRATTPTERIHQSRVAMRRIRSNLRTFRLLLDPAWGTSLRAELAWYGNCLGQARDLNIISELMAGKGAEYIDPFAVAQIESVVAERTAGALAAIGAQRGGARRFQLTEQMMVLWDGPAFKAKAAKPADDILPRMLHRAWHDVRGAAHAARKNPNFGNLHILRIRIKDLRYGCNTVALVEGGPARKTAKATEHLQVKLGDLHDAYYSIEWLQALALERRDLLRPIETLIALQREAATAARKGWKADLKDIERRWRRWHG